MNGRNRHIQYRKSVYRRRKIRTVIITLSIALAVLIVSFFIIGFLLNKQSEKRNSKEDSMQTTEINTLAQKLPLAAVQAYPVLLETADSSTFASRLEGLQASGITCASVPLNTADGALLYRSPVAIGLGLQVAQAQSVSIANAVAHAEDIPVSLSGVYYVTAFTEEDDLLRSVRLSHDAAILAEALRDGIDNVLLIVPAMTEANVAEILRLLDQVRVLCAHAVLGVTVPTSVAYSESGAKTIDTLYESADFLALNAFEYGDADPVTYISDTIAESGMRYYLLRYGMRVLIPAGTEAIPQESLINAVTNGGSQNYQIIP